MQRFLNWSKINSEKQIDLILIKEYKSWLEKQNLEDSTQNYHFIALRSFLKYLSKQQIKTLSFDKIKLTKKEKKFSNLLEEDEIEILRQAPLKSKEKKIIRLRDSAILELFLSTGLKVSQLANLKRKQINFEKNSFNIILKNNKTQIIQLTNQVKYNLKKYLKTRNATASSLFVRHDRAKGKEAPMHLTPRSIQRLIQKYGKFAGIVKKITPHTLRQTFRSID